MFSMFYPIPFRNIGDEIWYLGTAIKWLEQGVYYRNVMFNDFDGGELRQMFSIGQPTPLHQHLLPYHFPGYSTWLAAFYVATNKSMFWTIAISQTLCMLAIVLLTYLLAHRFGMNRVWACVAALVLMVSPSITYFFPNILPEMLLVALCLACFVMADWAHKPWHHALCGVLISMLILTRYGFLPHAGLIVLWQLWRARREKAPYWPVLFYTLPFICYVTMGLNGHLFYRPLATKCVFSMPFDQIVLNTFENMYFFWQGVLLFPGPRALMASQQIYLYLFIPLIALCLPQFRRHSLFTVACIAYFATLAGTIVLCSWWGWQHIRLSLWFMPFAAIFAVFLLTRLWAKQRIIALLVAGFLAWEMGVDTFHVFRKLRDEAQDGRNSWAVSRQLYDWVGKHAYEGALVSVPLFSMGLTALMDPTRTYGISANFTLDFWARTYRDTGAMPDLILLKQENYKIANALEEQFLLHYRMQADEFSVTVPGEETPLQFIVLERGDL